MFRHNKKQRSEEIDNKCHMHAEPGCGRADRVGKNSDKGLSNDVWILRVGKLGLDKVPQDVGMQSHEQQRVERLDFGVVALRLKQFTYLYRLRA